MIYPDDFLNKIICGDCLEVMKHLPDKSIDLILQDPPYNIGKASWDKIKNYVEWCGKWIKEAERILKNNGSFYIFHNDIEQIAELMLWIKKNTKFIFNSFIVWEKENFRTNAWKNPRKDNNLRSWFNVCEYILFYTFQDETGLTTVKLDINNFSTLRGYFRDLQGYVGLTRKQIIEIIGQKADHCFRWNSSQWELPTKKTYQELIDVFKINKWQKFREYENLRQEYENLRQEYENLRYTYNISENHNNVWRSRLRSDGRNHPTEKPLNIIEKIIKTSSNENDTVFDGFAGSGTTCVAAKKLNRNFIGIEILPEYCAIAEKRLANTYHMPSLWEE